ncbi:prepilin-type N-terminal cleavage/methylation domain-containing protein [Sansalvadorimonas sp. 2012CJ34-2]|uniref:Prepilin-type N-terminal cleavage/methylation domain-containing protein n=1 Tax=Parendozoicomonas callyspongiae TaxID=2942213 RepID=A0ABT0PDP1_9GAMM|nr:type IV pilin protein [Sansalvadorimonas sp. 2012CJ34-2]MCL6269489.1 prepilin-type N-terminal cleavage/methylation domain-containing protein [Sansalvadorimonas sp. 2012CJ34-2]
MAIQRAVPRIGAFSLIELLISMVILSILIGFAYPSYRQHVVKANRSDAHIAIQRIAMAQERNYAILHRYSDNMASLGGTTSSEGYYTLASFTGHSGSGISDCGDVSSDTDATGSYTIIAQPVASKSQSSDADCTCIYMDSRGVKGSTGARAEAGDCW